MGIEAIQQFIEESFPIVKRRNRSRDLLLQLKCPICGDNKKPLNKNRVRAAFIVVKDNIFYQCFNCGKSWSISTNIRNLAYIYCRQYEIPFSDALIKLSKLAGHFIESASTSTSQVYKPDREFQKVIVPGSRLQESGIKWLANRGFTKVEFIKQFKQDGQWLFVPLIWNKMPIGYLRISIERKRYIVQTDSNEIDDLLFGLEDVTPATEAFLIVESLLDAKLITQDSDHYVVGLALVGASFGKERIKLIETLDKKTVINFDNDQTGKREFEKLRRIKPTWLGSFTPSPCKDYGEYRKKVGPIVALHTLVGNAKELRSPALDLMRIGT